MFRLDRKRLLLTDSQFLTYHYLRYIKFSQHLSTFDNIDDIIFGLLKRTERTAEKCAKQLPNNHSLRAYWYFFQKFDWSFLFDEANKANYKAEKH